MAPFFRTSMIAGLGSNGSASISSELLEILKEVLGVVKYLKVSLVTEEINEDAELMIGDGLPVDVDNLLMNISW